MPSNSALQPTRTAATVSVGFILQRARFVRLSAGPLGGRRTNVIQGLRTAIYPTPDLQAGKTWYAQVLGFEPYFDEPFYVGFAVSGFELGLIPDGEPGASGVQVYWGTMDAAAELTRLVSMGGTVHEPIQDV